MDLEAIIKEKEFIELTVEERELIADIAPNEEAYNQMKSFLLATANAFSEDKVMASDQLKQQVMEELYAPISSRATWLTSFFSFLFPKDTPVYRYPAFQLSLIVVLCLGLFFMLDNPMKTETLAMHDTVKVERDDIIKGQEANDAVNQLNGIDPEANQKDDNLNKIELEEIEKPMPPAEVMNIDLLTPEVEMADNMSESIEDDLEFEGDFKSDSDEPVAFQMNELKDQDFTTTLNANTTTQQDVIISAYKKLESDDVLVAEEDVEEEAEEAISKIESKEVSAAPTMIMDEVMTTSTAEPKNRANQLSVKAFEKAPIKPKTIKASSELFGLFKAAK